jgi:hypothetical protein
MKNLFLLIFILIFISNCESAREGFKLKKDNTDEFLIEKKNPLIMPPDYSDLPEPKDFGKEGIDVDQDNFEKIISKSKKKNDNTNSKKTNIEKSILEKIN